MKKKQQKVSMVVAELLGLCVSLWSVSAMAECRTYNLYGDLWFSDRRVGTLSQAQWLTLGPAPNVEVQLVLSPGTLSFVDIESSQPSSWWCPSGVECNSEDFDDYEGATNIYTDLNGHWSVDVILCLREPVGEYGIQIRPNFKMQNPEWKVVDEHLKVYEVFGHSKSLASADAMGALDYQVTGIPWFVWKERAMWVFQGMREAWNFVEVDGGCRFPGPCGFDLAKAEAIRVLVPRDQRVVREEDGKVDEFRCTAAFGCGWIDRITVFEWTDTIYHEYGHLCLHTVVRGIQAESVAYGMPWGEIHEDWANFLKLATKDYDFTKYGEKNDCGLYGVRILRIMIDLYDDSPVDCSANGQTCDRLQHGVGQILAVIWHMSDAELNELREFMNSMADLYTTDTTAMKIVHENSVTEFSAMYVAESDEIYQTGWYRAMLIGLFLLNCVLL